MTYRYLDAKDVEPQHGVLRPIRRTLEIESFGVNEIELPPNSETYPEHDETKTNHDELYIVLEGSATMTIDGETLGLVPGHYVYVTPESKHHIAPGSSGLRYVAIGAPAEGKHGGRI